MSRSPSPSASAPAPHFDPEADFDRAFAVAVARRVRRFFRPGDRVLELGCATGLMTSLFVERDVSVTAVDRSVTAIDAARTRGLPRAAFHAASVEELAPDQPFEHVVAAHLINELDDPAAFLAGCRRWLAPGGLLHVSVCNARSVHRLVALELGMLDGLTTPGSGVARFSAGEMIDGEQLVELGAAAGLACLHREPVILKPLPNARMAALPDDVIEALDAIVHRFPEHGGVNYAIFAPEGAAS
jgi:2-polyprenyl-3-methyl-5-hydroxy-6-metoxy-1,4-benzoquinol methylase